MNKVASPNTEWDKLWEKPLLNLEEVGLMLGKSRGTIYKLREQGILRASRIPGTRSWLVQREDLLKLISGGYADEPEVTGEVSGY